MFNVLQPNFINSINNNHVKNLTASIEIISGVYNFIYVLPGTFISKIINSLCSGIIAQTLSEVFKYGIFYTNQKLEHCSQETKKTAKTALAILGITSCTSLCLSEYSCGNRILASRVQAYVLNTISSSVLNLKNEEETEATDVQVHTLTGSYTVTKDTEEKYENLANLASSIARTSMYLLLPCTSNLVILYSVSVIAGNTVKALTLNALYHNTQPLTPQPQQ